MSTPSVRAQIVEARTYLRPLNRDATIFETPEQCVNRIVSHQRWLWQRAKGGMRQIGSNDLTGERMWNLVELVPSEEDELQEFRQLLLDRKVTVSGRTRWLGGTEVSRRIEASQFNCAFLEIHNVYDVVDAVWLLLQGCGVGFKMVPGALNGFSQRMEVEVIRSKRGPYEKGRAENVETFDTDTKVWTIVVGDSSQAWARASGKLLAGKFPAKKLVIDFSEVRGPGGRLSSYGWISAGDNQISIAFEAIAKILNRRADKLLTAIDILDVMNWLGTILSSRRSAEIALLDYDSPESATFAGAKWNYFDENPQRGMSNNSLMFSSYPGRSEIAHVVNSMVQFGGSEPGFINAEHARKRAPWFHGVNPCGEILLGDKSFCVAADTPLITREGVVNIGDAVGQEIEIWNGLKWSKVSPFKTGDANKMLRVHFGDGSYLDCTEYHRFSVKNRFEDTYRTVEASKLREERYTVSTEGFKIENTGGVSVPNAYTVGVAYGDGWGNEVTLYGDKANLRIEGRYQKNTYRQNPQVPQTTVDLTFNIDTFNVDDVFKWDRESALAFVAGLADTDGANTATGGIRIYQADEAFIRKVYLILLKNGIRSSVCLQADAGQQTNFGPRKKALWYLSITDVRDMPCQRLTTTRESTCSKKNAHQTIVRVEALDGRQPSFCFTEQERGMGVFNGTLTYQCNLVETVLSRFNGDRRGLDRAHYLVARANYRQTCVNLDDGVLQRGWHELNEFLRLCGVGVTGVVKWDEQHNEYRWEELRHIARFGANSMADELNMPRSKAVTTVKPSGTQSKIMGLEGDEIPEGLHTPMSRFIFNNVRFTKYDQNVEKLRNAGYHIFPDPYNDTDVLVRLPVEFTDVKFDEFTRPDGSVIYVNNESAIEQLERYRLLMNHYVDHNASVTISYDTAEVPDIIDWLADNWDEYVGVSFLFRNDVSKTAADLGYPYLPQEVVTEEAFREYVAGLKPVNVHATQEAFDIDAATRNENPVEENDCATGACPIR